METMRNRTHSVLGLQGHLAHKKQPLPRILQWAYAQGPNVVLVGGEFLMSEVPL